MSALIESPTLVRVARSVQRLLLGRLLLTVGWAAHSEEAWVDYEPAVIELSGRVVPRNYFGPPNFGESPEIDEKRTAVILVLTHPINVRGNPVDPVNQETERDVREIQLAFQRENDPRLAVGRDVVVRGRLSHSFSAYHVTKVLLSVQDWVPRSRQERERTEPSAGAPSLR